jgi:hypothetical protein
MENAGSGLEGTSSACDSVREQINQEPCHSWLCRARIKSRRWQGKKGHTHRVPMRVPKMTGRIVACRQRRRNPSINRRGSLEGEKTVLELWKVDGRGMRDFSLESHNYVG